MSRTQRQVPKLLVLLTLASAAVWAALQLAS